MRAVTRMSGPETSIALGRSFDERGDKVILDRGYGKADLEDGAPATEAYLQARVDCFARHRDPGLEAQLVGRGLRPRGDLRRVGAGAGHLGHHHAGTAQCARTQVHQVELAGQAVGAAVLRHR